MLVALAVALVAAFVGAPRTLAASRSGGGFVDERHLGEALRKAFVEYWRSGDRDFSPGLERVVEYWFRYHVAKAVIAAILLIVLVALGVLVWKAFLRAGGLGAGRQAALASAGVLVMMLAVFSLAMVMANVQGAVAPFASLLPMLTDGPTDGDLAGTLALASWCRSSAGVAVRGLEYRRDGRANASQKAIPAGSSCDGQAGARRSSG